MNGFMKCIQIIACLYQLYVYEQTMIGSYRISMSIIMHYVIAGAVLWIFSLWISEIYLIWLIIVSGFILYKIHHMLKDRVAMLWLCVSYLLGYGGIVVLSAGYEIYAFYPGTHTIGGLILLNISFFVQIMMLQHRHKVYDQMYLYPLKACIIFFIFIVVIVLSLAIESMLLECAFYAMLLSITAMYRHCFCMEVQNIKEWEAMQKHQMMVNNQERYERIQKEHDFILRSLHDIKKQMIVLESAGIKDDVYYQGLKAKADMIAEQHSCGETLLDQVLHYYQLRFHEAGIQCNVESEGIDYSFMDPVDMSALLCNMLDNAYESCCHCEQRFILLKMHEKQGRIFWKMKNSAVKNSYVKSELEHGFGLRNMQDIVKRYQGELQVEVDETHQIYVTTLYLLTTCV